MQARIPILWTIYPPGFGTVGESGYGAMTTAIDTIVGTETYGANHVANDNTSDWKVDPD
jgi:hypothetical protein